MPADRSPAPLHVDPGAGMDAARIPGHVLLTRLGKRVLRPGGITMTRRILDGLDIRADDRGPSSSLPDRGRGPARARPVPASYIGVGQDGTTVAALSPDGGTVVRSHQGEAERTGPPDGSPRLRTGKR